MDDLIAVGSRHYFFFLMLLLVSRGADFLSTWIATPNMVLEGNPLAKMLGWKWGSFINLVLCGVFAAWPLAVPLLITTATIFVAVYQILFSDSLCGATPGVRLARMASTSRENDEQAARFR